jgi:hypothetical protein
MYTPEASSNPHPRRHCGVLPRRWKQLDKHTLTAV